MSFDVSCKRCHGSMFEVIENRDKEGLRCVECGQIMTIRLKKDYVSGKVDLCETCGFNTLMGCGSHMGCIKEDEGERS